VERQRSSPLVRKIAKEHHLDISKIPGTGIRGRVTRDDIQSFLARTSQPVSSAVEEPDLTAGPETSFAALGAGLAGQTVPMSVMRRKIAEHMTASQRTSAHVHSVFEVNFAKVEEFRQARKGDFERAGAKLTYLAFIVSAVAQALADAPVLNASVQDDKIVYHAAINIGIAVALDWGLIVPVIRDVSRKDLLSLSRAIGDLAARARTKQLKADEVAGGTFTVTNPGALGALLGTPIINQPQVAILGVGAIEKRPVVVHDAIAIRPVGHLTLGFDHRIIDGAVADTFMSRVKRTLENWDSSHT
jgi:2-oxoglutarate dehydrogenase E2 component (dihydrolipoamide succinyltransferase)